MHNEALVYLDNRYLNQAEFRLGRLHLQSMPRYLTLVLGNGCNIDCRHCYQLKNGDNLLRDPELGTTLRRELSSFYPFLSTLRLQGGEVFALRGFEQMLDDVQALVRRPLISISSNGTLINERWARRLVELPLQSLTISLDAATPETYAKLRRGGEFEVVLNNLRRLQSIKRELGSAYPVIDTFFVIMRSNFREIPAYLALMAALGVRRASFQVMLVDERNLVREPDLGRDECLGTPEEVRELHALLQTVMERQAPHFHSLSWSGVSDLLRSHGLDSDFLHEQASTLTPDQDQRDSECLPDGTALTRFTEHVPPEIHPELGAFPGLRPEDEDPTQHTCPNPWSTLFITENGDVSLCFLSEPVGNLYQTPLVSIWNSPAAVAKRSHMLAGRYLGSGCSGLWCRWREGQTAAQSSVQSWRELLALTRDLVARLQHAQLPQPEASLLDPRDRKGLQAVRRLLQARDTRIHELEAMVVKLWEQNGHLHEAGQRHIDHLEAELAALQRPGA